MGVKFTDKIIYKLFKKYGKIDEISKTDDNKFILKYSKSISTIEIENFPGLKVHIC